MEQCPQFAVLQVSRNGCQRHWIGPEWFKNDGTRATMEMGSNTIKYLGHSVQFVNYVDKSSGCFTG